MLKGRPACSNPLWSSSRTPPFFPVHIIDRRPSLGETAQQPLNRSRAGRAKRRRHNAVEDKGHQRLQRWTPQAVALQESADLIGRIPPAIPREVAEVIRLRFVIDARNGVEQDLARIAELGLRS